MVKERLLRYRAGASARRMIKNVGFETSLIRVFVAPASGPKWLVLAGLDRAMMASGLLGGSGHSRQLLVGSSAGGWRVMAMASSTPEKTHQQLLEGYIHQIFPRGVRSTEVSEAYRRMLSGIFTGAIRSEIVTSSRYDVAVHVARARGLAGSRYRWLQALAMLTAAGSNIATASSMRLFFKPILFHTRPEAWKPRFDGIVASLTQENFPDVALATGSVPLYFRPVADIGGAPPGRYIDGGMLHYHLNQKYLEDKHGIVVFPHFQRRIVPNWFDRYVERRAPSSDMTDNVLQIYPSEGFVRTLPGGRIPTRDDFKLFVDAPEERIGRWQSVVEASERLGDQLLQDLETGCIPDLIESF